MDKSDSAVADIVSVSIISSSSSKNTSTTKGKKNETLNNFIRKNNGLIIEEHVEDSEGEDGTLCVRFLSGNCVLDKCRKAHREGDLNEDIILDKTIIPDMIPMPLDLHSLLDADGYIPWRAASLESLLNRLLSIEGESSQRFQDIFLTTFPYFITSKQLLSTLVNRFQEKSCRCTSNGNSCCKHQLTIVSFLRTWILSPFVEDDLVSNKDIFEYLETFLRFLLKCGAIHTDVNLMLKKTLELTTKKNVKRNGKKVKSKSRLKFSPFSRKCFNKYSALDIAEQVTKIDYKELKKISSRELILGRWRDKKTDHLAENVVSYRAMFERRIYWVAQTIMTLEIPDPIERAKMLSRFIEIAHECYLLNNFNAVFAIIIALANHTQSLENAWKLVSEDTQLLYYTYKDLIDSKGQNRNYRHEVERARSSSHHPLILAVHIGLSDCFNAHDSQEDTLFGLIHWNKYERLYNAIESLLQLKNNKVTTGKRNNSDSNLVSSRASSTISRSPNSGIFRKLAVRLKRNSRSSSKLLDDTFPHTLTDNGALMRTLEAIIDETPKYTFKELSKMAKEVKATENNAFVDSMLAADFL